MCIDILNLFRRFLDDVYSRFMLKIRGKMEWILFLVQSFDIKKIARKRINRVFLITMFTPISYLIHFFVTQIYFLH